MNFEQRKVQFLYKKLIAFYPPEFKTRFGESMEQTFRDICREHLRNFHKIPLGIVIWMFTETVVGIVRENLIELKRGKFMENVIKTNKIATIVSFILALPFITILTLLLLNIEPPFASLIDNPNPDQPDVLGTLIVLSSFLLSIVALFILRKPIVQTIRGGKIFAHPTNLILATVIFAFVMTFVVHIIVDQYPCWMGVPNCD